MRSAPVALAALLAVAGLAGCDTAGDSDVACACPSGMTNAGPDDVAPPAVDVDGCSCAPLQPCIEPNVGAVEGDEWVCRTVDGFWRVPPSTQVDLGFGVRWDASAATP